RGEAEILDPSEFGENCDHDWQQHLDLVIVPDARLSSAQQAVVAHDYGMTAGKLVLKTRATLVNYQLQLLRLDPARQHENPLAQQVMLENHDALAPWIFD
ncbi:MAG: hypothetical protein NWP69_11070, partial [Congregibacter sp.]|nr:hypothetical protein [Congregibacter sp.]